MTDTTDIKALLEHNQHIVAHLTRSNPRRPLSSAEVLTLESAKLVVASLSVRDGPPDADHSEYWFEHEGKLLFDGALFNSRVEIFIESKLEAERQRAERAKSALDSMTRQRDEVERLRIVLCDDKENLIDRCIERDKEIAELKGGQVPVGKFAGWGLYRADTDSFGNWLKDNPREETDQAIAKIGYVNVRLFTAPQKPVVLPEKFYIAAKTGPTEFYVAGDIHAAIEAAGGIIIVEPTAD